ncbi:MAG: hypothetical protein K1X51_16630 [Rhodospirillaceae bacterium]|nr:hypothetical protein [Rhodospirillaceae bacterium]
MPLRWKTKNRGKLKILVDDLSMFLSLDKVTMYMLLDSFDIPIPSIKATYLSRRPVYLRQLDSHDDLMVFLSEASNLPVYIKRSFGSYGRGNVLVTECDGNMVRFGNGSQENISEFCQSLDCTRALGWILQEPLMPHPEIKRLTGSGKISGIRIHTFLTEKKSQVIKAIFKINAGVRDSDNFEHGASGNMLAAVDVQTGNVIRAIAGTGLVQKEIPIHPATGERLVGFQIPYWKDIISLTNDAQLAFPGYLCPGWDIALCADGPKVLEINAFGDADLSQHAYRVGFLDNTFISLMRERGLDQLLTMPPNNSIQSKTNNRFGIRKHHWKW